MELFQIKPDFPKQPREYVKLLFVIDEHVEMILDGLVKGREDARRGVRVCFGLKDKSPHV
jgi:hypothetical protein